MKRILSLFIAIVVTFSLSGCQSQSSNELIDSVGSDITTKTLEADEDYDPYNHPAYPLPDGWTFEKICGLIKIDGAPLTFPCTTENMEKMSDKILIGKPDEIYNYSDVFYNEENIGYLAINPETNECDFVYLSFWDKACIKEMTFADFLFEQTGEIEAFMSENFTLSHEYYSSDADKAYFKIYKFEYDNKILEMKLLFSNDVLNTIFIKFE